VPAINKHHIGLLLGFCLIILIAGCGTGAYVIEPIPSRQGLTETKVQQDPGWFVTDKIAIIDVDGVMMNEQQSGLLRVGENPVSMFAEKLDKAKRDKNVKAVILRLNTPGGTVAASDIMHHYLIEFKKETQKPVLAYMMDVTASGGYYLACACDGMIAQPTTVTGSIGTILQTISFEGTMQKIGMKAEAIKSGKMKDMASPLHDLKEEERQLLQSIIDQYYENFLTVVLDGRKNLDREKLLPLADGRVFTGKQALEAGLIDRIGYPTDAIAWAKKLANISKVKIVTYHRPYGYKPNFYASSENIDPQSLINIELPKCFRSEGARFLYLWQPNLD
jgi:protease-4